MSKRYSDFIILKNGILDKYPLKNYLFARYLVTEGKEKEIKGKAGIIELLQSIDFSLNICDVDPDLANEFTAAKTYATYLFQSYKADGTIDISEAAKKALQLFKLQTPTAPQLTDTNLSYSNMFPHLSQLLASNNLLSNDNNNHASSPIPATNPEISSLNNSESETTAISSLDMPYLENSLEHHEHSLIPSGSIPTANKTYHQFKIPAPDKTHVRQQQLEEELKKLRERENQIKEEQLFLQKIKQFDQKGSYDSPQKRAKEDIQKRYSEFFISKQSDEKKNSPSRPNLKLLKNPYTP